MIDTNLRTSRFINFLDNLYHKILFLYAKKGFDVIKKKHFIVKICRAKV